MKMNADMIYETKKRMLVKYPRFGSSIAGVNIEFRSDLRFKTAATDGKNIYVDPNYFASLSEDERLFLIAHEVLHIKFMHPYRLMNKEGEMKDPNVWNIATDAIINANLERDGFTIKEGYVNMPEALEYTAEEFYEILMERRKEQQENNSGMSANGDGENSSKQDGNDGQQMQGDGGQQGDMSGDDHSYWKEAFEEHQQESEDQKDGETKESSQRGQDNNENDEQEKTANQNWDGPNDVSFDVNEDVNEKEEFEQNRKEKIEKYKKRREQTEREIRGERDAQIEFGDIGESENVIDWKLLVRREVEKSETIWSQRRSIAENNYAYRLEENDVEDEAETEVMIDVSGSVDLMFVKAFLRELKPLLKESKVRVGCFNSKFWGMVDLNSQRDIDNFTIPLEARGAASGRTDLDLAARSFSKKKELNKIVFTDGYASYGMMPGEDLKNENIIWIVYDNKDYNPCCGKVIYINSRQLNQMRQVNNRINNWER